MNNTVMRNLVLLLAIVTASVAIVRTQTVGLPQQPVAPKTQSDLQDQSIKGRARTIQYESESQTGTNAGRGRRVIRTEEYTETGNLISKKYITNGTSVSWQYYGYIDGFRVSKSEGESGGSGISTGQVDLTPRDKRFEFKRLYEYNNGRLTKETLISNNSALWMTRVYKNRDGETEELVYDNKGKLNQKYLHKYDKDGNEIEYDRFDAFKDPDKIENRTKYTYISFDANGNWTQRTSSHDSGKDGEAPAAGDTVYRTISYYSDKQPSYPAIWFAPINDPNKPDWEILPQEARAGEVILSKRNELGILSNFAATPSGCSSAQSCKGPRVSKGGSETFN